MGIVASMAVAPPGLAFLLHLSTRGLYAFGCHFSRRFATQDVIPIVLSGMPLHADVLPPTYSVLPPGFSLLGFRYAALRWRCSSLRIRRSSFRIVAVCWLWRFTLW